MAAEAKRAKQQSLIAELLGRAVQFHIAGRLGEAEPAYKAILKEQPGHFDAKQLLGQLRFQQGRHEEAVALLRQALAVKSNVAAVHANLGHALAALNRHGQALAAYDRALAIAPGADGHNNRGLMLVALGRHTEAVAAYDKALAIAPDDANTFNNRGGAETELGRLDAALASFDAAIALKPDHAEAYTNRGVVLKHVKRYAEALASLDHALAIRPDFALAHNNRGTVLRDLDRLEEALAACDRALALAPRYADAWTNRGLVQYDLKCFDEALASFNQALTIAPQDAKASYNSGIVHLSRGAYAKGWSGWERRFELPEFPNRLFDLPCPLWTGQPLSGKRIVIYEDQGYGDVLQIARYLPLLARRGADVTFIVRRELHDLLMSLAPAPLLLDAPDGGRYDFQCDSMSLPAAFATTLDTIPADIPYLMVEPARVADWRAWLGAGGVRIGIAWQGNPAGRADVGRSVPLAMFAPLARIPGVRLVSLQKGHGTEQIAALPDLALEAPNPATFADTAAIMSSLDLIITTDTSVAHLAGSLGRPVWTALKFVPDWRWLTDRPDSPWYPTMRLYRQTSPGDWAAVFDRIVHDLHDFIAARATSVAGAA